MYDGHWFAGGFMWLFWILLILVVVLALKATLGGGRQDGESPPNKSPLQLLEERLARGEIDEEEFERKRRLLKG